MPDIPEEVYTAAADAGLVAQWRQAMRRIDNYPAEARAAHVRSLATGIEHRTIVESAYAAGRASFHAEWAAKIAEDGPPVDERVDLESRAEALARQLVEAKVRAEVAAEIRSEEKRLRSVWRDPGHVEIAGAYERAARIAEAGP